MPNYEYECEKCGKVFDFFKHMWEEPKVSCTCGGKATQRICCFETPKDKLFEFTDVHTTGKPLHFTSKRQWEKHLKRQGKYQLMSSDLKKMQEPVDRKSKSNYKDVVSQAWVEREKFKMELKYGRRKLGYA